MTIKEPQAAENDDYEVTEVFGEVDANLSMSQIFIGVFLANLATAVIVGGVVFLVLAFT